MGWLARLALLDGPAAKPSFVEGMGRWLGWADAIALAAALQAAPAVAAAGPVAVARARAAAAELERVRAALARAIEGDDAAPAGRRRPGLPVPAAVAAPPAEADFAAYRQRCTRLQQSMADAIRPLRAQARAAAAGLSPALARLAAIDAVMDEALAAHEQAVLAPLPSLLQRHFERLQQAHRDAAPAAADAAGKVADMAAPPGAWLDVFRQDMRQLLLAELDQRLQPVQGLIDAQRDALRDTAHQATRVE